MKVIASQFSNRVVIRQSEADKERGGILIPETSAEKPLMGEIVAVSECWIAPDGRVVTPATKIGDTVLYDQYSMTIIEVKGEELLVMDETKVFCVL